MCDALSNVDDVVSSHASLGKSSHYEVPGGDYVVISLAQVWVASARLRLAKKADEPAKAETEGSFEGEVASKEPSAEEPTSEKSSGCVAS